MQTWTKVTLTPPKTIEGIYCWKKEWLIILVGLSAAAYNKPKKDRKQSHHLQKPQPRSQGFSSPRSHERERVGKMRGPENEVDNSPSAGSKGMEGYPRLPGQEACKL